jgi:site-specific DNA-methyltransferase (cytosine-N4-specific)
MAEIPAGSIQTCVTSPPYYGLRDYGIAGQIGLEPSVGEFVERLVGVFREVRRVLRDDGTLWLNIGDSYAGSWGNQSRKEERGAQRPINGEMLQPVHDERYADRSNTGTIRDAGLKPKDLIGVPWRVAFALQADGWWLRDAIIWAKPNPMPSSVTDRCTPSYETVFMLAKSARYFADMDAVRTPHKADPASYKFPDGWGQGDEPRDVVEYSKANYRDSKRVKTTRDPNARGARQAPEPGEPNAFHPLGANMRNVWTIATEAFSDAHFATFPLELPLRCIRIGTSEAGCCSECGAPRRRLTEATYDAQGCTTNGPRSIENRDFTPGVEQRLVKTTSTLGFEPGCAHDAPSVGSVVLDPFMGSGTVAQAAESIGQRWVGYEINPAYHALIAERTRQIGLL